MKFPLNAEIYKRTGTEGARPSQALNKRLCKDLSGKRAWTTWKTKIKSLCIGRSE